MFSDARSAADHIKLPILCKLGYAVGSMPYSMCTTVMGFYLSLFLLEVALVSARKKANMSLIEKKNEGGRDEDERREGSDLFGRKCPVWCQYLWVQKE